MRLQRLFSFILALCLTLCLLPGIQADQAPVSLEQTIIDACRYRQEVDISGLNIKCDVFQQTFDRLFEEGKLPWYSNNDYQYTYNTANDQILTFTPATAAIAEEALITYEEKAAQVLKECVKEGMTQWQIALALHDYLIVNSVYDSTLEKNTPYDLLVNGTAVCAGYARAYQDLLLRAGIDCRYVISDEMKHAWNLVCIDGFWYHVDLTWDDPEPNIQGHVSHQYFLLTDAQIKADEKPHYNWDTDIACTDTRFQDSFWKNVNSAVWFEDNNTCYFLRTEKLSNRAYARKENASIETQIYTERVKPVDIGHGNYVYEHHGFTLRDGRLWFCTMTEVLSMKTDGTDRQTHYQKSGNVYIQGCHAGQQALQITLSDHDGNFTADTLELAPTDKHECTFVRTTVAPTEENPGYTLSQCSCGLEVKSLPTVLARPVTVNASANELLAKIRDLLGGKLWIPAVAVLALAGIGLLGRRRRK